MEDKENKVATRAEAETILQSSGTGYPQNKCVVYGDLVDIAKNTPLILSLPQGTDLNDASISVEDDFSLKITDTADKTFDTSAVVYYPLLENSVVHWYVDGARVSSHGYGGGGNMSYIATVPSDTLRSIRDSSFYDNSIGMEFWARPTEDSKWLTLEYLGTRSPGVDASYGFAVQYMGSSTQSTNSMLLFGVGMRGYGISLLQFGAGQIMNTLPGFFAHRLPGPFRNDSLTTITADKYPAFQRTLTAEDFSDAGTDRIRIQQMAFLLMNVSGALIGNAYVSYDIHVNNTSYARAQIPVNTTTSSSSINWTTINPIEITLGDSLTIMFQIVFEDN